MPEFSLRLSLPTTLPAGDGRRTFYWTTQPPGSIVTKIGNTHLGPSLGALGPVPQPNIEFVRLAAAVVTADRSLPRQRQGSNWSQRQFELSIPVADPTQWQPIRERLQKLLGFLSGDEWTLGFAATQSPSETIAAAPVQPPERAVLLSGGADSAIGALMSRIELGEEPQALVSHFGPTILRPIQSEIAAQIAAALPGEQLHRQINFTRRNHQINGAAFANEYSTRARSLLFLALGLAVASVYGVPLWVPENGFASLNPPLGPDRRGSLSTRTTHPRLLAELPTLLAEIGVHADLANPFDKVTKGEMFRQAGDAIGDNAASNLLSSTHSCAHTGHRTLGLSLRLQCGVCFGCTVRRAAFAASGLTDRTEYLTGLPADPRVDLYLTGKSVERSVRDFIDRGISTADVASLSLPASYPPRDALDLCQREIAELRNLFP